MTIVANRDEFHRRPTAALHWWSAAGEPMAAGRDLRDGGTWMGINRRLRWGVLLNRPTASAGGNKAATDATTGATTGASNAGNPMRSRGELIPHWLDSHGDAAEFLQHMQGVKHLYHGFNLIVGEGGNGAMCLSSPTGTIYPYSQGVHAFSNCEPDIYQGKTGLLRTRLNEALQRGANSTDLLRILGPEANPQEARADDLDFSQLLFIRTPEYGTGRSTVLHLDAKGKVAILEQQWNAAGMPGDQTELVFAGSGSLSSDELSDGPSDSPADAVPVSPETPS